MTRNIFCLVKHLESDTIILLRKGFLPPKKSPITEKDATGQRVLFIGPIFFALRLDKFLETYSAFKTGNKHPNDFSDSLN